MCSRRGSRCSSRRGKDSSKEELVGAGEEYRKKRVKRKDDRRDRRRGRGRRISTTAREQNKGRRMVQV